MARPAPAAARAAGIVSFLTSHSSRGFTISELARHLRLNLASAHATLAVLSDSGFVVRDPMHRTYVLGPALAATGFAALEQHPAIEAAIEQAGLLAEELEAEVSVHGLAGRDVILLARRGQAPLTLSIGYPGDRTPLLAPIGAIFLAWADHGEVEAWLERGQVARSVAEHYRAVLADVRARGFSVPMQPIADPTVLEAMARVRNEPIDDEAEHRLTDVFGQTDEMLIVFDSLSETDAVSFKTVAAPIFDSIGRVLLSLSVTGPEQPVPLDDVLRLGHRLVQAAAIATRQGRGRAPEGIDTKSALL